MAIIRGPLAPIAHFQMPMNIALALRINIQLLPCICDQCSLKCFSQCYSVQCKCLCSTYLQKYFGDIMLSTRFSPYWKHSRSFKYEEWVTSLSLFFFNQYHFIDKMTKPYELICCSAEINFVLYLGSSQISQILFMCSHL